MSEFSGISKGRWFMDGHSRNLRRNSAQWNSPGIIMLAILHLLLAIWLSILPKCRFPRRLYFYFNEAPFHSRKVKQHASTECAKRLLSFRTEILREFRRTFGPEMVNLSWNLLWAIKDIGRLFQSWRESLFISDLYCDFVLIWNLLLERSGETFLIYTDQPNFSKWMTTRILYNCDGEHKVRLGYFDLKLSQSIRPVTFELDHARCPVCERRDN